MTTQFIITILAISVYTASVVWRDEWTYFCWHANVVPAFFQGPFQWPAHYLPLWMGMLQYSLGCGTSFIFPREVALFPFGVRFFQSL